MAFRIKIETLMFPKKTRDFPSLELVGLKLRRDFDTLTELLEYVLGPNGFRKEILSHYDGDIEWEFRWFEILPDKSLKQLDNVRHFHGNYAMEDEIFGGNKGSFLLDRSTGINDEILMRMTHPEWGWKNEEVINEEK